MSDNTKIEWTEATWQVTAGCSKISPGCKNCYAERMANRLRWMAIHDQKSGRDPGTKTRYLDVVTDVGRWNGRVVTLDENLTIPLHWKKPRMVFVNSMSDLFHPAVPFELIDRVFYEVLAVADQHTYQILTKRPERAAEFFAWPKRKIQGSMRYGKWPLPNVWIGTTVENQAAADERIPHLLRCPAAVRFLSVEPLLGPMPRLALDGINWVIVGGESGPAARPCDVAWIRSIVRQCQAAGVKCFVKQDSGPRSGMQGRIPNDLWIKDMPEVVR